MWHLFVIFLWETPNNMYFLCKLGNIWPEDSIETNGSVQSGIRLISSEKAKGLFEFDPSKRIKKTEPTLRRLCCFKFNLKKIANTENLLINDCADVPDKRTRDRRLYSHYRQGQQTRPFRTWIEQWFLFIYLFFVKAPPSKPLTKASQFGVFPFMCCRGRHAVPAQWKQDQRWSNSSHQSYNCNLY